MPDFNMKALASTFLQAINGGSPGGISLWAVRAEAIGEGLNAARELRDPGPSGNGLAIDSRRGQSYGKGSFVRVIGATAVVPVTGPINARRNWSFASYDEIAGDIAMVAQDPDIEAILIDVNSPGGMVANIDTAVNAIRQASEIKPVTAFIDGIGASAAYWLAAAAGRVIASPTSLVGSVGSLIRYVDLEGILTRMGATTVEVIASQSPNKRLDPNSEEGRAELQAIADDGAEMFLAGLEQSRGVRRADILENYGQGLVFHAREALKRGMIDAVMTLEETLADLAARGDDPERADAAVAQNGQETIMADKETGQAEKPAKTPVTVEGLRAAHGDLINGIEAAAETRGATAERERILGIEAQAMPGQDALIAEMKADGKTTPAEAAVRVLSAMKAQGGGALAMLEKMDRAAEGVVSTPSGASPDGVKPKASTPEGWKAEWEASDKLKAEFPTVESYVATMKREAA
jgi:signal peptide peptidase SppA